jgi:hypothetical protein
MTAVDPGHVATLRTLVSHSVRWATIHAVTCGSFTAVPSWPATSRITAPNAMAASAPPTGERQPEPPGALGEDAGSLRLVQSCLCADARRGSARRLPQAGPQDVGAEEQDPCGKQQSDPDGRGNADKQGGGDGESGHSMAAKSRPLPENSDAKNRSSRCPIRSRATPPGSPPGKTTAGGPGSCDAEGASGRRPDDRRDGIT